MSGGATGAAPARYAPAPVAQALQPASQKRTLAVVVTRKQPRDEFRMALYSGRELLSVQTAMVTRTTPRSAKVAAQASSGPSRFETKTAAERSPAPAPASARIDALIKLVLPAWPDAISIQAWMRRSKSRPKPGVSPTPSAYQGAWLDEPLKTSHSQSGMCRPTAGKPASRRRPAFWRP